MNRINVDFIENRAGAGLRLRIVNRGAQSVGTPLEHNAAVAFFRDLRDSFREVDHRTTIHAEDRNIEIELPPRVVRRLYRPPAP